MDELYRGYRIAIKQTGSWTARITHVRGTVVPLSATATLNEGAGQCLIRARQVINNYLTFLEQNQLDGEPN